MQKDSNIVIITAGKSTGLAYVLLIFLGHLGAHRFYLNRPISAIIQLVMGVIGWATSFILVGFFLLVPLWLWIIIDLFLVSSMVRDENIKISSNIKRNIA